VYEFLKDQDVCSHEVKIRYKVYSIERLLFKRDLPLALDAFNSLVTDYEDEDDCAALMMMLAMMMLVMMMLVDDDVVDDDDDDNDDNDDDDWISHNVYYV
jgi:hypothetical protein